MNYNYAIKKIIVKKEIFIKSRGLPCGES